MAHQLGSKKYVTGLKSEKRRKKDPRLAVWMGAFLSWLCSTTMVPHTPFYIEEDEEVPFFDFTSCSAPASTEASQVILLSWRGPATTQVLHVRVQRRCIVVQVQHLLQPAWEREQQGGAAHAQLWVRQGRALRRPHQLLAELH
jgi:hypothetical protein